MKTHNIAWFNYNPNSTDGGWQTREEAKQNARAGYSICRKLKINIITGKIEDITDLPGDQTP